MKLRVGIIGLGKAWETRYRPAFRALVDRYEVRAVCDQVAHLAERAASEFKAQACDGYRPMLDREDIDAIFLLAPQWYGPLPILAACESGKAVYCASMLDLDWEQAELVKQRVEKSGIAFMAEFAHRLSPATLRLKELIATRLGKPRMLFCHHRFAAEHENADGNGRDGRTDHSRTMIELVDWCRYVVDAEPATVFGVRHHADDDVDKTDYEMMSLDFSDSERLGTGPLAQISAAHYVPTDWPEALSFRTPAALQVACENGIAFVDLPSQLIWFDQAGRHLESLESERPAGEQLILHFFRHVTSLVRLASSLQDAYRSLLIVKAARRSSCEGQRVDLGE